MSDGHHLIHAHISKKKKITWFDNAAIIAALIYPLCGLPQVIEVFQGNSEGVSIASWLSFMVFELFFLIYGIVHKLKPIIVTDTLWLIIDGLIVIGVLLNRMAQ